MAHQHAAIRSPSELPQPQDPGPPRPYPGAQFGYHPGGWGKPRGRIREPRLRRRVRRARVGRRRLHPVRRRPRTPKAVGRARELSESESEDEEEEEEEESDAGEEALGEMAAGIATGATGGDPEAPMDLRVAPRRTPRSCTACWTRERRTWRTASWEAHVRARCRR